MQRFRFTSAASLHPAEFPLQHGKFTVRFTKAHRFSVEATTKRFERFVGIVHHVNPFATAVHFIWTTDVKRFEAQARMHRFRTLSAIVRGQLDDHGRSKG
ncbi:hypothetical protein [Stenomitos frigidus]|uniref:Uncharacterized protein n=1 Tax=Stenomitos frigidus ULC18 TaxID=2107698 RepID=A0A2T1E788_9CYAN|nr:hypothetical protein [Stenomitos frigidus]PSB28555.1 hypothetical protein C7B82_13030 [Stenomitos frigidus ULC18]